MHGAAPQSAMPQPNFVPVMPSTSRNTQSSGVSPSTSTLCVLPLTLMVKATRNPVGQRHAPLLVAFANDAEHSFGVLDIADLNLGSLADAQATGIHQLKAGPVDRIAHLSQDNITRVPAFKRSGTSSGFRRLNVAELTWVPTFKRNVPQARSDERANYFSRIRVALSPVVDKGG
jgi:hypothetical protein